MIITLCSSASFFHELFAIAKSLEDRCHTVYFPSMVDYHGLEYHGLEKTELLKIQNDLIRGHFKKISKSDAIYVANYAKNGIEGYIGGSVFLEMGKAFDKRIHIFLMNEVPKTIGYREELLALEPIVIGQDWEKIERYY